MRKKAQAAAAVCMILGVTSIFFGNDLLIRLESERPSRSMGSPASGQLLNGKRLPSRGSNFRAYSRLGSLLGRTSVHHQVRETVLETYASLRASLPEKKFTYGETGWPGGGPFYPHKTHQNGMSVDFFVPLLDPQGRSAYFPCSPFNRFGYGVEFDENGRTPNYVIDFRAMAAHLETLNQTAKKHRLHLSKVIFDPRLQPLLFQAAAGRPILNSLPVSKKPAWVRHDEHYHVDFSTD